MSIYLLDYLVQEVSSKDRKREKLKEEKGGTKVAKSEAVIPNVSIDLRVSTKSVDLNHEELLTNLVDRYKGNN